MRMFDDQGKLANRLVSSISGVSVDKALLDIEVNSRRMVGRDILKEFGLVLASELVLIYLLYGAIIAGHYPMAILILVPIVLMGNLFVQYIYHKTNDAYFRRLWLHGIIKMTATVQVQKTHLSPLISEDDMESTMKIPAETHRYITAMADLISSKIDNGDESE